MAQLIDYENVTTTVKLRGEDIKIHGLCTGMVAVKKNFRSKKGWGGFAKLNILLDSDFTEYLPIWVWVIEHPEGTIIIDTGESSDINNLDCYLSQENGFSRFQFKHACKFSITRRNELDYQFESIGLKLEQVDLVILTHLHLDHTDGLKFFPKKEIIVGDFEFRNPSNNMPSTYPSWFSPHRVKYLANRIEIFESGYPVTDSEDLLYIPTPGHTKGHSSVIFKTDDFDIIFAGDASYSQNQVLQNDPAGVNSDYAATIKTYQKLLEYAAFRKVIYLPTHDEAAGERLSRKLLMECGSRL